MQAFLNKHTWGHNLTPWFILMMSNSAYSKKTPTCGNPLEKQWSAPNRSQPHRFLLIPFYGLLILDLLHYLLNNYRQKVNYVIMETISDLSGLLCSAGSSTLSPTCTSSPSSWSLSSSAAAAEGGWEINTERIDAKLNSAALGCLGSH